MWDNVFSLSLCVCVAWIYVYPNKRGVFCVVVVVAAAAACRGVLINKSQLLHTHTCLAARWT